RLPLLLSPIMERVHKTTSTLYVGLIGPWSSSTLRAMLPEREIIPKGETAKEWLQKKYPIPLRQEITKILGNIDVYSATARAMDAILVQTSDNDRPRQRVGKELQEIGFKSFQNFVATEDQLASEILDELDLRGIAFTNENNH